MDADKLVIERRTTHGSFVHNATVAQSLKDVIRNHENYKTLSLTQREALDFMCSKIGRIMSGEPSFPDHWDDIAGYAKIANTTSADEEVRAALAKELQQMTRPPVIQADPSEVDAFQFGEQDGDQ